MGSSKRIACWLLVLACLSCALAPARAQKGQGDDELVLYNWPNFMPPALLARFTRETGIRIRLEIYESNEQMLARVREPDHGVDLVVPTDYAVARMIREGLAEPIDAAALPNFANVAAPHDAPPYDPARRFSAPFLWGTVGFSYDADVLDGAAVADSWSVLFDPPDALKGRIAMLDDEVEVFNAAAYYLGIDPCTSDAGAHQRILMLLERQSAHVADYASTGTVTRMLTGAVAAHMQWNSSAHRVRRSRANVVYVYPKEGIGWWQDNFVVPRGAPHVENARTFIDWILAPRNAAEASNFSGYMNAVSGSARYLDPGLRDDPAINMPTEFAARLRAVETCPQAARDVRHQTWQRFRP